MEVCSKTPFEFRKSKIEDRNPAHSSMLSFYGEMEVFPRTLFEFRKSKTENQEPAHPSMFSITLSYVRLCTMHNICVTCHVATMTRRHRGRGTWGGASPTVILTHLRVKRPATSIGVRVFDF